jgi:hypothetical protein
MFWIMLLGRQHFMFVKWVLGVSKWNKSKEYIKVALLYLKVMLAAQGKTED